MEDPMAIDKKLIDQLLTDYKEPEDIIGENGLLKQLTKGAGGRDDRSSGLRKARPGGPPSGKHAQRKKPKNLDGRVRRLARTLPIAATRKQSRSRRCGVHCPTDTIRLAYAR
jgi:putative transposase